jgi:hypothetical protein
MPTEDRTDNIACSFCGKNQDQVRKLIAGPKVFICDECVDLCEDILAEETLVDEAPTRSQEPLAPAPPYLAPPQIVSHYTNSDIRGCTTTHLDGVDWLCDGCRWKLRLRPGVSPPSEHSEELQLGTWPGPLAEPSRRELVPPCPNPSWRRIL